MINKLVEKIKKTKAPIVVGLDPMLSYVPEHILKKALKEYGETLEGAAQAIWLYNKEIIDCVSDLIPAVKPQIAMYEQFGVEGLKVFQKTVDYCHEKVSVGSKKYAAFNEDFVTVNPYLGTDGIKPFVDICKEEKKGLFILVKTSNPSSGEFQDQMIAEKHLYELVGEHVAELMGDSYSYVGAVVGATYPEQGKLLRKIMPKSFILVPGYGAQGGKGADLVHFFNEDGLGAIINSSRGIITAYKNEAYASFGAEHFGEAARAAVLDMIKDINSALEGR